jgi:2-desacetyl-2-hydroxyethyl bacteriochlorophyllide A dehydrogenase
MKAAIVEAPGRLAVRDLPMPVPGRYEVLTEQLYGSICAATDRHLIAGELPIPGISYPLILGHESIGRVVEAGAGVRHLRPGDLVTRTGAPELEGCKPFWGGFAEYGIARDFAAMRDDGLPEAEWAPFAINRALPPGTDAASATMAITWRETHSYLARLGVPEGAAVLVLGSGGNGFAFAVLARLMGAATVAMLGNPRWEAHARGAGVAAFADYRDPGAVDVLRQAVPGGFALVVDAVGRTGGLERAMELLAPGGSVGMYGIEDLGERMAFLKGLGERSVRVHGPGEYSEAEAHDAVVALMEAGRLDAGLWFDAGAAVPLAEFPRALAAIEERETLKAVVRLRS